MSNLLDAYNIETLRISQIVYKKRRDSMIKTLNKAIKKVKASKSPYFEIGYNFTKEKLTIIEYLSNKNNITNINLVSKDFTLAWLKVRIYFLKKNNEKNNKINIIFYNELINKTHKELLKMCDDKDVSTVGSKSLLIFNLYFNIR